MAGTEVERMRVIYKYPMTNPTSMRVPSGIVRAVAAQNPDDVLPTVWVEHSAERMADPIPDAAPQIEIAIIGTGHKFALLPDEWTFVGTVVCADGRLVWHCWQRPVSGGA